MTTISEFHNCKLCTFALCAFASLKIVSSKNNSVSNDPLPIIELETILVCVNSAVVDQGSYSADVYYHILKAT